MRVYLVRHGKALPKEQDSQRPLSPEGRQEVRSIAVQLSLAGLSVSQIRHSGKARARQTAELLAAGVRHEEVVESDGLAPNDPVDDMLYELAARTEDLMIVGHLPFLNKLASLLLAYDESAGLVSFRNAGFVCLESIANGEWKMAWMITPELL